MSGTDTIAKMVYDEIGKLLETPDLKWDNGRLFSFHPHNPVSRSSYHGINLMMLGLASMVNKWNPSFMTFNQARALGASVMKGAKSLPVVFWKMNSFKDKQDPDKSKTIPLLRYYRVFNVAQIEGLPEKYATPPENSALTKIPEAEAVATDYLEKNAIDVVETFGSPHYSPSNDTIGMPPLAHYKTSARYYESLFHEMIHSTGHESRLKRFTASNAHFGTGEYSREELVAEFGAAILLSHTGSIEGFRNLAAYIKGWWKKAGEQVKDLIVASGKGEKAVNYILGIETTYDKEGDE